MTIAESIERFHDYMATERRMAARTIANYDLVLGELEQYLHSQLIDTLDDLEARDLRAWEMGHVERGEAASTVKLRMSAVSSWLRYLRRQGFFDKDLMSKLSSPKQPHRLPVYYREKEVERLYDEGLFADDFFGQRDRLLLRMLYETGMRRAELAGLREESVNLHTLTIKVLGKRNKERVVPIESELVHNIYEYLTLKHQTMEGSEWLFVNRKNQQMSGSDIYYVVRKYMTSLSTADRISPHVFRHSFATHILNEGGSIRAIQELLGHENLQTTEIYTHVTREHLKDVYTHAHPRGKKK